MAECWRAAGDLGLMIQMHFIPHYAPQIGELAAKFRNTPVLLDHLARAGHGTPADYDEVLKLAELPRVILKYSSWGDYKGDLGRLTKRLYDRSEEHTSEL